jgi:large subunit ribosomal protein L10
MRDQRYDLRFRGVGMNKGEKRQKAEALHQELEKSRTVILSGFEGITVAQDFDLRRRVARIGAKYKVVKNSLIERASQGTPLEPATKELSGTTSLAYAQEDSVALAKVLTAYARENPLLKFKSGVVEGRVVSLVDLNALATLPSKEQLFSKVLFLIKSPAQRVASTLSGVARNLAYVIQQGVKESKFSGEG